MSREQGSSLHHLSEVLLDLIHELLPSNRQSSEHHYVLDLRLIRVFPLFVHSLDHGFETTRHGVRHLKVPNAVRRDDKLV